MKKRGLFGKRYKFPLLVQSLEMVAGDLSKPEMLKECLVDRGYDPKMPTLIMAEGLHQYIKKDDNIKLMKVKSHDTISCLEIMFFFFFF